MPPTGDAANRLPGHEAAESRDRKSGNVTDPLRLSSTGDSDSACRPPAIEYVSLMAMVRMILIAMLVIPSFAACESSSTEFEQSSEVRRPEVNPPDDDGREAPPPKGFVAHAKDDVLHREDCPRVEEIPEADRVEYAKPHPALDDGCVPCDYCEPLK